MAPKGACDRVFQEAGVAHSRHKATEKRERELSASVAALGRQAWEREAIAPVPTEGLSIYKVGICTLEEALEMVASEQNLESDRLEVLERQVMTTEAAQASRETKVQVEIVEGIMGVCRALAKDYHNKLKLQEIRFCTRRDELKVEIDDIKK